MLGSSPGLHIAAAHSAMKLLAFSSIPALFSCHKSSCFRRSSFWFPGASQACMLCEGWKEGVARALCASIHIMVVVCSSKNWIHNGALYIKATAMMQWSWAIGEHKTCTVDAMVLPSWSPHDLWQQRFQLKQGINALFSSTNWTNRQYYYWFSCCRHICTSD